MDADHAASPVSRAPRPGDGAAAGGRSASDPPAADALPRAEQVSRWTRPRGGEDSFTVLSRIIAAHPRSAPHRKDSGRWAARGDDGREIEVGRSVHDLEAALDEKP